MYSHSRPFPFGTLISGTAHHFQGGPTVALTVDGGTIDDGITDGAGYVPVTIKASSNFVVQFGYDTNFYCTSRLESCYVQASTIQTVPFLYASESGATTPTSSTVAIPAMPGRVLYYRLWIGGVAGQVNAIAN